MRPRVAPLFLFVVVGSVVAGAVLARLYMWLTFRVKEVPSSIILQFVGTFGVWLLADRVGLSGVLTVVVYGIVIAQRAPMLVPARLRVPSYAVWETMVFVLNVLAFLLIGLQLGPIWGRLSHVQRLNYVGVAGAVLATAIVVRIAWVMTYNTIVRWKIRRYGHHPARPMLAPTIRGGLIISWCGMRGIVTLAAALALPDGRNGPPFPHRDLIVLCAFSVVLGTLVLQGFTLRPLLVRLDLQDDGGVDREVDLARSNALQAGLDTLKDDGSPEASAIRLEYADALRRAAASPDGHVPALSGNNPRRRAVVAARDAIGDLRSRGEIGDDAFHRVEEDLDWLELSTGARWLVKRIRREAFCRIARASSISSEFSPWCIPEVGGSDRASHGISPA